MDKLLALAFGILIYSLILLIFKPHGTRRDSVRKRLNYVANTTMKGVPEDDELSKPLSERFIKPLIKDFMQRLNKYIPDERSGQNSSSSQYTSKLRRMLRQAGIKLNVNEYRWIRTIVMTGTAVIAAMIAVFLKLGVISVVLFAVLGIYAVYVLFRFDLSYRISKRGSSMERQMPEVLDMLSVSVEAGLGLEQSMLYIVNNFEGPLIDEISVSNREMAMGRSRRDALLNLGDRCEIDEMKTFVRAIVQAGGLGISIKNVLRSQAAVMRESRKNKIEEKAMQISVNIDPNGAFHIPGHIYRIAGTGSR
jgi:tight adherence protein C